MTLHSLIQRWVDLGFSLIPTNQEKKPTVLWKDYQIRKPSDSELNRWFSENSNNPAVVCGAISGGLAVVDCDDPHIAGLLKIDTLTIGTPSGGLHLYVWSKKIPDKVQAYHGYALDVQGNKSYALLPPAKTEKGEYTIIKDAPIVEFDDILVYLDSKLPILSNDRERDIQKFKENVGTNILTKWLKKEYEGHNYWQVTCPFHGDDDPSLTIYDNGYHCFGCGEHGDIIDFVMKKEGIGFLKAIDMLSNISGVEAPEKKPLVKALASFKTPSVFEMAEAMQERNPIYYDRTRNYWLWVGNHYEMVDETDILLSLREIVDDERKILGNQKNAILDAIRITGRARKIKEVLKSWIHTKDAVIDLKSGTQITPSPEYLLTAPIPHKIGNSTETPTIDRLFTEWAGVDNKQILYEICAYCLADDYPIHRLFLLFGRGRNGKGQYREIILRLVGRSNCASTSIEGLTNSRFESARLYKKKVAAIGETNFALLENTAILKMLTGGDPIPAEFKNCNPFEFYNTAKLIINTNSLPPTSDKTDAFYSRFVVINFPNQFPKGKDIVDTIPDEEYENLLAKCIQILPGLLDKGEFSDEGTIQQKAEIYESISNPLNVFISDNFTRDINEVVPFWHFSETFLSYLKLRSLRVLSDKELRKQLKNEGYDFEPNHRFKEFDNKQWTGIKGLQWKNNPYLRKELKKTPEKTQGLQTVGGVVGDVKTTPTKKQCPPTTVVGDVGDVGVLPLSSLYREISNSTPTSSTTPTKELTNCIELKLDVWEKQHHEKINSTNLTKACFDLKPMFPDINMDDLANHIRKIAKITPTNSNGDKPPLKKGKEIEIPFNDWSLDRLKAGKKTATSRTKKYGNPGDLFKVDGVEYVLTTITEKPLIEIAEHYFKAEGAESSDEFIEVWRSIHRKKGFVPDQIVFYHEFANISTNGNGSEDSDQKPSQHHCHDCGALPAKNLSESAIGKKTYYCEPCYKTLCEKRGAKI